MIKTAREEAWEEKFQKDIETMKKEILVKINEDLSLDNQFVLDKSGVIASQDRDKLFYLFSRHSADEKIKWKIELGGRKNNIMINVSHRDEYTKAELERAKKQILTLIYRALKL